MEERIEHMNPVRRVLQGQYSFWVTFWLWGVVGNALYIVVFFVWPVQLIAMVGRKDNAGFYLGIVFIIVSALYMIFSFVAGMHVTWNNRAELDPSKIVATVASVVLLIVGSVLWLDFTLLLWFPTYIVGGLFS